MRSYYLNIPPKDLGLISVFMVKSGKNGRYVSEVYGCFSYFMLSVLSVENTEEQQPAANH